jgi:hypothetical protein
MNRLNMSRVTLLTLTTALASANAVNGLTHGDETPTADPTDARSQAADVRADGDLVIVEARGPEISSFPLEAMRNSEADDQDENREALSNDQETRPMLGIGMADGDRGVLITDVYPGTPAHQAGLRPGDEIMGPDDDRFDTERLAEMMSDLRPGQRVEMRFLRDGEEMNTQVRLASWNSRLMEQEDSDHPSDDRERPEMNRIVEMLREVIPGMFEDGDLNRDMAMDIDIEVFEEDGNLDLSIMRSSEEFVRAVDDLDGISEVIIMMIEEMLADEEEHEGRDEGHEEAWEEDGQEHEWKEDEGHGEELQHHVERMLEEAWMDMKGWSADLEDGIHQMAGEFDHRFEEFARMVDERLHGMEKGVDHRFDDFERMRDDAGDMIGNMMQDRDRGIEDMLRDRDEMMKKMAERFHRRLEETSRNVEDTLRRMVENQARLAERNRMLETRLERLEKAMRDGRGDGDSQRRGARNLRKDRDAGNRNQDRRQRRNRDQASQEDSDRPRNRRDAAN